MRKKARFHSLKKIKVRQDWSRWTLYNLSRLKPPNLASKTYFQQKWTAKSDTRAYHGEQVREKQWKRMFRRNLPAVVSMNYQYLARYDGSEQAAGRGAGADTTPGKDNRPENPPRTPYMQMAYYPLERRLDTAIFRALFSSSVRQARQFVVHGLVKVNGKKMVYPGYMLNPGDMFQVEPESVMFATGAPKHQSGRARRTERSLAQKRAEEREGKILKSMAPTKVPLLAEEAAAAPPDAKSDAPPTEKELKKNLQSLMEEADAALAEDVGAKDKQKLRDFRKAVRKALSLWRSSSTTTTLATLEQQLSFLKSQFASKNPSPPSLSTSGADPSPTTPSPDSETSLSPEQQTKLAAAFKRLKEEAEYTFKWGKRDPTKPYATPWRPRDYMSAFAFIPRYLEVNQKVCAAVYLRHPVARPGLAEVPTPFGYETGQLAFNWYLKRR
ncbi:alpha-L RNA-binding motif-containing protein [Delitschia confertaspora ATCC 74209]|uniref:Alpha-L RNA-binding motif-containing protein n=1 Tax=Delitschia confertaspora ATCC 74209 TaxID=1513339 RepID=A0A9P4MX31_9PLEO|nr:alpha-L RNA-binding motif-containing protein [Delitschia confertaspora ATCC 74209]